MKSEEVVKKMTNKEKLKAIVFYCWMRGECDYTKEETERFYKDIEKDLEVLEILKNHKPSFYRLKICDNVKHYNLIYEDETTPKLFSDKILSNEEFTLLKEWLENDTPRT